LVGSNGLASGLGAVSLKQSAHSQHPFPHPGIRLTGQQRAFGWG
jgi:hypothetical protein